MFALICAHETSRDFQKTFPFLSKGVYCLSRLPFFAPRSGLQGGCRAASVDANIKKLTVSFLVQEPQQRFKSCKTTRNLETHRFFNPCEALLAQAMEAAVERFPEDDPDKEADQLEAPSAGQDVFTALQDVLKCIQQTGKSATSS